MFVSHKPAEDFQQLSHAVEVLSFINEPEKTTRTVKNKKYFYCRWRFAYYGIKKAKMSNNLGNFFVLFDGSPVPEEDVVDLFADVSSEAQ